MLCRARNSLSRSSTSTHHGGRYYYSTKVPQTQNPIPASFLRGGTSKGIFINASHLPQDRSLWKPILLGLMGSPDPMYGRQLDGMGGGVSSLSKVCVVGFPTAGTMVKARAERLEGKSPQGEPVDVEYTFVQVGIKDDSIDLSGNCGNLSAMVGVFAVDEGLVTVPRLSKEKMGSMLHGNIRTATVKAFNTNTRKFISTSFPVATPSYASPGSSDRLVTPILDLPQTNVAGVPRKGSQILLQFHNPAGARTGKLLPTGEPVTTLTIDIPTNGYDSTTTTTKGKAKARVKASLVDATNPTVFVCYDELASGLRLPMKDYLAGRQPATDYVTPILEAIRQEGAKAMGLDPSAQAQPKIAILSDPAFSPLLGGEQERGEADIVVHALSMGVLHKAVPMTVGLCLGVAAKIEGTLAWNLIHQSREAFQRDKNKELVCILHPGGLVEVGAEVDKDGSVKSAQVVRTGRRLMTGRVYW